MNMQLILNVLLMYAILIGVNLPAPFLGLSFRETEPRRRLWFEPPGFVIPLAWFILFTLLGIARHLLLTAGGEPSGGWLIIVLAVLCACYAYYTLGLARLTGVSALWFGLGGNLAVIILALVVALLLRPISATVSLLVLPVAVWTGYATAIVLGEMRAQRLV